MKTSLLYGAMMAIASAVLTLLLFFLGFHSDPAKMQSAQLIGLAGTIAIVVSGLVLGIRARRADWPIEKRFGYGQALVSGILLGVFATLFMSVFQMLYTTLINPGFLDVIMQQQTAKLEASGMPSEQVDKALGIMRMMLSPAAQFIVGFISGIFWCLVISLIVAAFLKRPDPSTAAPPLPGATA